MTLSTRTHISIQIQGFFPWTASPLVWLHCSVFVAAECALLLWDQGVKTPVVLPSLQNRPLNNRSNNNNKKNQTLMAVETRKRAVTA